MRKRAIPILCLLMLLLSLVPSRPAAAWDTSCPASLVLVGVNTEKKPIPLYSAASPRSQALAHIPAGKRCEILGRSGAYYCALYEGQTGFVSKKLIALQGKAASAELPAITEGQLSLQDPIPRQANGKRITLRGTLRASRPIEEIQVFLWDERLMRADKAYLISFSAPRKTIDAASLQAQLPLNGVSAGRKALVLQAVSGGKPYAVFRTVLSIRGDVPEPAHITGKCAVSSGDVIDDSRKTVWQPTMEHPSLIVRIPAGARPSLCTMTWRNRPKAVTVECFGENDQLLERQTLSTGFYQDHAALTEDVRKIVITPEGGKGAMSALRVYGPRYDRLSVQQWEPLPDRTDLLFFSTHQDDEWLFFGGAIPYYCHRGAKVAVVYAVNCGRSRYQEALDGLWAAGLPYHPVFLGWHNFKSSTLQGALNDWKKRNGDVLRKLVRTLRRCRPSVVVTQDFKGEYGHPQHQATAALMKKAILLAADESYDPASVKSMGTWQIQKMYVHLYKENAITMNWNAPLEEGGVITPLFLAKEAFDRHQSQHKGFSMETTANQYDCRLFGLYYSAVGPDVNKNDFLENVRPE